MEESGSTIQPHRSNSQNSSLRNDVKDKNIEISNKTKVPKREFSRLVLLLNVISAKGMGT